MDHCNASICFPLHLLFSYVCSSELIGIKTHTPFIGCDVFAACNMLGVYTKLVSPTAWMYVHPGCSEASAPTVLCTPRARARGERNPDRFRTSPYGPLFRKVRIPNTLLRNIQGIRRGEENVLCSRYVRVLTAYTLGARWLCGMFGTVVDTRVVQTGRLQIRSLVVRTTTQCNDASPGLCTTGINNCIPGTLYPWGWWSPN